MSRDLARIILAAIVLGLLLLPAASQPSNQTYSVLMCATGVIDANGAPQVIPCGYVTNPIEVTQTFLPGAPLYPVQPTTACPANPISKKIPPLC